MTTEETAKRRAWAAIHFGDRNLTDEELATATYMPSGNFSDGWDRGAEWMLRHQWVRVDERMPDPGTSCLVSGWEDLDFNGRLTRYTMMAWYDGEDFYDAYSEYKYHPVMWMAVPTPQLTPGKEER